MLLKRNVYTKRLKRFLSLLLAVMVITIYVPTFTVHAAEAVELVTNGGMEDGGIIWQWGGYANNRVQDATVFHTGTHSLKITTTPAEAKDNNPFVYSPIAASQLSDSNVGDVYDFSAWVKLDQSATKSETFKWCCTTEGDYKDIPIITHIVAPGDQWTNVTSTVVITADMKQRGFTIRVYEQQKTEQSIFNIDDVSFKASSTTTQITPTAPNVVADDTANTVTGMAAGMEYKLDSAEYVAYNETTFSAIDFSGVHTLLIRVAATENNLTGVATTLNFTTNPTTTPIPTDNNHVGVEYYVAVNGSDSNAGTIEHPFATVNKFISVADQGDTCYVRGGLYNNSTTKNNKTDITKTGAPGKYITIKNYANEVPIFDGNFYQPGAFFGWANTHYVILQGLIMQNYVMSGINGGYNVTGADETSNYIIRYCVVDRCGQNGISFGRADHITYENNMVSRTGWNMSFGSWSSGLNMIEMFGKENYVRNNISFHNVDVSSHHTDGNGFILDTSKRANPAEDGGATVENNLFFGNGGVGIAWTKADNAIIKNNTLYENGMDPNYVNGQCGIAFWDANLGITMKNNIIYQKNKVGMKATPALVGNDISDNNISGKTGAHNPLFVDPLSGDFSLQNISPDIDRGTTISGMTESIGMDSKIIKNEVTGQPMDWFTYAPDIDYIVSKGGFEKCFTSQTRPKGSGYDLGAFESNATNPNPTAVIADEPMPAPGPAVAAELLTNPGFEGSDAFPWFTMGCTILTKNDIPNSHSGYKFVQIDGRTAFWNGIGQDIAGKVENGKTYKVSGWVKVPQGEPDANININLALGIDGVEDTKLIGTDIATSSGWKKISGTITTPETGLITAFKVMAQAPYAATDTAVWMLDDFSVKIDLSQPILEKKAIMGTPNAIDGIADSSWDAESFTTFGLDSSKIKFKTTWDANNLYVLATIPDTTIDSKDKVDVFIDENNDKKATYGEDDKHYTISRSGVKGTGVFDATVKENGSSGYSVEFRLPLATAKILGSAIGFDIRTTDNDTVVAWNDQKLEQDTSAVSFGKVKFVNTPKHTVAYKGTPVIDGTQDSIWNNAVSIDSSIITGVTGTTKGTFKAFWDEDYLYILADVADTKALNKENAAPYLQDSIEIFKDENNEKTNTYQYDDAQIRINFDNEASFNNSDASYLTSSVIKTANGYKVEARIKWSMTHVVGDLIGYDAQVNDTEGTAGRTGNLNWNDITNMGWQSTAGFGVMTLTTPTPSTPLSPGVSADDVTNTITGIDETMEFKIDDEATYTKYTGSNLPDLSGNHTVYVRVSAVGINQAGDDATLNFTTNPVPPVVMSPVVQPSLSTNDVTAVVNGIKNASSNATITVDVTANKQVSKDIFDAIKGTDKTVTFTQDGAQWSFNGKDITGDAKAIDMKVNVTSLDNSTTPNKVDIGNKVKNADVVVISFANNGQLPGKATIKLKVDSKWLTGKDNNNLSIYYYNETTKQIEAIASGLKVDAEGNVQFEITHNSDYIISDKNLATSPVVVRLAGTDRYGTSVKVSQSKWTSSDYAVLATGDDFADALCAAPFAKQINAPILLTSGGKLDASVSAELSRLKVKNVYIIGGIGAISTTVENALTAMNIKVERISGKDRYETSLKLAQKMNKGSQLFVCAGTNFPDAVSISSYAAATGSPILLTEKNQITADIAKFIKDNNSKVYVIGGTGVIADRVVDGITGAERVSGDDRYKTNLAILNKFVSGFDFSGIYLATGEDYPDAICGSVLASREKSPIILVDGKDNSEQNTYIKSILEKVKVINVLGGEGVISSNTVEYLLK